MTISELLHLLRRPLTPITPEASKGRRGNPAEPPAPLPITEPELVAALESVATERNAAEDVITEASGRRDRLLLAVNSDDAIFAVQRDLDGAQLRLERLDRLEPEIRARLHSVRYAARQARWIEVRDGFVAATRQHAEMVAALEAKRASWTEERERLLSEFGDAHQVISDWPLSSEAAGAFVGGLERLALTVHDPEGSAVQLWRTVDDIVDEARRTGRDPELSTYRAEITTLLAQEVRVSYRAPCRDALGVHREGGAIVVMTGAEARAEVQAGRAMILENADVR